MPSSTPRGFTLLELLLVLALVGFVLGVATLLFSQVQLVHRTVVAEAQRGDARAAGMRRLRRLVRTAEVLADSTTRFVGDERAARFNTACTAPGGWLERCRVSLELGASGDTGFVIAHEPNVEFRAQHGRPGAEFRYLRRASADTVWLGSWGSSSVLPAAIAAVNGADTLVLPIGAHHE